MSELEQLVNSLAVKLSPRVTNEELLEELYCCRNWNALSSKLLGMFNKMIDDLLGKKRFNSLTYQEDMKAQAFVDLIRLWTRYKPEVSRNAYAYFIQVIKSSFIHYMSREKQQDQIKENLHGAIK